MPRCGDVQPDAIFLANMIWACSKAFFPADGKLAWVHQVSKKLPSCRHLHCTTHSQLYMLIVHERHKSQATHLKVQQCVNMIILTKKHLLSANLQHIQEQPMLLPNKLGTRLQILRMFHNWQVNQWVWLSLQRMEDSVFLPHGPVLHL